MCIKVVGWQCNEFILQKNGKSAPTKDVMGYYTVDLIITIFLFKISKCQKYSQTSI